MIDLISFKKKGVVIFDFVGFTEAKIIANKIRTLCEFEIPNPLKCNGIEQGFRYANGVDVDELRLEVEQLQVQLAPFRFWPEVILNRVTAYDFPDGGIWDTHQVPQHIDHPVAIMFFEGGSSFTFFDEEEKRQAKINPQPGDIILFKPELEHKITVNEGLSCLMCIISCDSAPTEQW